MMSRGFERIAITGVGAVSALGPDAATTFGRLVAGDVAIAPLGLFDTDGQRSRMAAEVTGLSVADVAPRDQIEAWSRSDALAVLAAREAVRSARLDATARLHLAVGATTGGMFEAEDVLASMSGAGSADSVRRLLAYPLSTSADRIAETLGRVDRRVTICSACSSGAVALVQGASWLAAGQADAVLAGGTDGLCRLTFTGFNALGATSPEACRPFDVRRDGLTLGEGAAFVVLEPESAARRRGARVLAWLSGWAVAAEAHHITHPEPSGAIAAGLIRQALERAGLSTRDLDYVNAHGTGTLANDAMEARALSAALGDEAERVVVSSSKGQLGHTLGAAGALEAVATVLALAEGVLPPTGGLEQPDPALPLHHVIGRGRPAALRAALSSSFGFGGTSAVLAFEHADAAARPVARDARPLAITAAVTLGAGRLMEGSGCALHAGEAGSGEALPADPLSLLDAARSRRFDRASTLVSLGAERALAAAGLGRDGVGLVAGTAFGNVERSVAFLRRVLDRGPRFASPADFPHLLPSAPSGNASIYAGLTGPVVSVSDVSTSPEAALAVGASFVSLGLANAVIAGSAEPEDRIVQQVLGPLHAGREASAAEGAAWLLIEAHREAVERGATVLARIARIASRADELEPPRDPLRALVVVAAKEVERLAGSAWVDVPRRGLVADVGAHEARGGFALAAGVALVARGTADDVLVCGSERDRVYLVHLRSP